MSIRRKVIEILTWLRGLSEKTDEDLDAELDNKAVSASLSYDLSRGLRILDPFEVQNLFEPVPDDPHGRTYILGVANDGRLVFGIGYPGDTCYIRSMPEDVN